MIIIHDLLMLLKYISPKRGFKLVWRKKRHRTRQNEGSSACSPSGSMEVRAASSRLTWEIIYVHLISEHRSKSLDRCLDSATFTLNSVEVRADWLFNSFASSHICWISVTFSARLKIDASSGTDLCIQHVKSSSTSISRHEYTRADSNDTSSLESLRVSFLKSLFKPTL